MAEENSQVFCVCHCVSNSSTKKEQPMALMCHRLLGWPDLVDADLFSADINEEQNAAPADLPNLWPVGALRVGNDSARNEAFAGHALHELAGTRPESGDGDELSHGSPPRF